ncbi:uncharacterized protein METZ01_LOCUS396542, partial [marine metagenome]
MGWLEKRHFGEDVVIEEFTDQRCVLTLRVCYFI